MGKQYLSFDMLQDISMKCDVETAKNLRLLCQDMNRNMNKKILQPLGPSNEGLTILYSLKIRKEKGVDELVLLAANGKTVVAPLSKYMKYIWYIHCEELEISISKDELSTVWKEIYEHFRKNCDDMTIVSTDDFSPEDVSSMTDMVLYVIRPMRKIRKIIVDDDNIIFAHEDMDHIVDEDDLHYVTIKFPTSGGFSADFMISVIERAPFSELCQISLLSNFDTVQPAIAAFASTQKSVPDEVFVKLSDKDFAFELLSSGAKLHISDRLTDFNDEYYFDVEENAHELYDFGL